ncbi:hypothetical protein SAMN05443999_103126 [Roseovarius azorensis]|uniref:Uncharacterized protein n=1 Tax=Roseovarius azorensis TaxID=1287727 RepID=A0A1H7LSK6_9RHOB|nr:hypothetical protein [Roseovarius azorensis]SEL01933.1 hypothetical protein SAMN05443999_103126 [Roseovarius azorensis]
MIAAIWRSFRRLPLRVQIWVAMILVSVNAASLLWWDAPMGAWVAGMAVGAMLLNGVLMLIERGFSRAMALPHVLIWTPLMALVIWLLSQHIATGYRRYLLVLLVVDGISLALDYADSWKWWKGDRRIA